MHWYEFEAMVLEVYLLRRHGKISDYLVEESDAISRAVKETGKFSEDLQERAGRLSNAMQSPVYKAYLDECIEKEITEYCRN